jgi:hypothetical protein
MICGSLPQRRKVCLPLVKKVVLRKNQETVDLPLEAKTVDLSLEVRTVEVCLPLEVRRVDLSLEEMKEIGMSLQDHCQQGVGDH